MPTATTAEQSTELQKSIFNAPPSSIPSKPTGTNGLKPAGVPSAGMPQGTKRPREDEEGGSGGEDAPMEEGDESDAPMEGSSDED